MTRPDDPTGETLIVATDTGITAALGLLADDEFAARRESTTLVWCLSAPDYFLPMAWVAERAGCALQLAVVQPVGNSDRLPAAMRAVREVVRGESPTSAYLVGDGGIVAELAERLVARGTAPERVYVEYFFNNPSRST